MKFKIGDRINAKDSWFKMHYFTNLDTDTVFILTNHSKSPNFDWYGVLDIGPPGTFGWLEKDMVPVIELTPKADRIFRDIMTEQEAPSGNMAGNGSVLGPNSVNTTGKMQGPGLYAPGDARMPKSMGVMGRRGKINVKKRKKKRKNKKK